MSTRNTKVGSVLDAVTPLLREGEEVIVSALVVLSGDGAADRAYGLASLLATALGTRSIVRNDHSGVDKCYLYVGNDDVTIAWPKLDAGEYDERGGDER